MISIASTGEVLGALSGARSIVFTAYFLPRGAMRDALRAAAARGAKVTVRLEGRPCPDTGGNLAGLNARAAADLRAAGACVDIVDTGARNGPPLHMKAALCDGVAYLDDRNFAAKSAGTILRDVVPSHVRAIESAARHGIATSTRGFWTSKRDALAGEAQLLRGSLHAHEVDVESESFGASKQTYAALARLAAYGVPCKLLVTKRAVNAVSLPALRKLQRLGVQVRAGRFDEKMAVVDANRAWTGSANATTNYLNGDQIDWGLRTGSKSVVAALHERFTANWERSQQLKTE